MVQDVFCRFRGFSIESFIVIIKFIRDCPRFGSCDEFEKTNIHIEGAVSLMKKLEEYVKSIPDFPEKGIIFRDVTSVLQDAEGLHLAIDQMQEKLEGVDFDVVLAH